MSVYNGEPTVTQALASVVAQTHPPDAVVVVDDGSTDGTVSSVEAWANLLPLTLVRHDTNRGVSVGRKSGIDVATTDVVLAIDADDVWLPHHLASLLQAFDERRGIVSPMAVAWVPESANAVTWHRRLQPVPRVQDLEHLVIMNWLFSGSMFERAAFDTAGGLYRFPGCEDWDLWLRLVGAGVAVSVLDEPTVLYRVHEGSLSADDRQLPTEIQVLEAFETETSDPSLRSIAQRSLRYRRARLTLRESYEHARRGQRQAAREAALKSLRGSAPVGLRAAAMAVAPLTTARWRDRARGLVPS